MDLKPAVATPSQERRKTGIYGTPVVGAAAPKVFSALFPAVGFPDFVYDAVDDGDVDRQDSPWRVQTSSKESLGSCITMPLKLAVIPYLDALTPQAQAIGSVNTTYFNAAGQHIGTNTDTFGVKGALLTALLGRSTPFPAGTPTAFAPGKVAGLMIGGGGATRAAIYALNELNVGPVLLVNRDRAESQGIVKQFPELEVIDVDTLEKADEVLGELRQKGISLAAGVCAIPSIEPKTDAEKLVYAISEKLFSEPYSPSTKAAADDQGGFVTLPPKPVHVAMAYKPPMTITRVIAEKHGWATVCGVEVVLEGSFEQARIWTGVEANLETREKARECLRG